jgi:hypothetical protein
MRRQRNRSEYGTTFIGQAQVSAAIADARAMVTAVRARL